MRAVRLAVMVVTSRSPTPERLQLREKVAGVSQRVALAAAGVQQGLVTESLPLVAWELVEETVAQ